jgi:hypothetical protein
MANYDNTAPAASVPPGAPPGRIPGHDMLSAQPSMPEMQDRMRRDGHSSRATVTGPLTLPEFAPGDMAENWSEDVREAIGR